MGLPNRQWAAYSVRQGGSSGQGAAAPRATGDGHRPVSWVGGGEGGLRSKAVGLGRWLVAGCGGCVGGREGLRRCAAWGCAGALRGAALRRSMGLRMGAAWGCARAQHGAAQGRSVGRR